MGAAAMVAAALNGKGVSLDEDTGDGTAEPHARGNGRPVLDTNVWQMRDDGDYINTKTGEVRSLDEFDLPVEAGRSSAGDGGDVEEWGENQDGRTGIEGEQAGTSFFDNQDTGDAFGGSQLYRGKKK